jgi:anti-anti-sigma factor
MLKPDRTGDVAVLSLKGRFFGQTEKKLDEIRQVVDRLVEEGNDKLVLDMGRVDQMDSRTIGMLIALWQEYNQRGGAVKLCSLANKSETLLMTVRLLDKFEHFSTRREAIASFG